MKIIKSLVLMMIPLIFLVGCSSLNTNTDNISKKAIERKTMTKVQSDVNVIMEKSYDYVLENMGKPYSTIYSLKIDDINDFHDLEKIKNIGDIKVLSTGLLYPKYTSDYKLDGSAIYISLKDKKVCEVETCDFKNFDISQVKAENSNLAISIYKDFDDLNAENIDKDSLKNYIGKDKNSISKLIKHKKCEYSVYVDVDDGLDIDIYNIDDGQFLIVAYEDNSIVYIDERNCYNLISLVREKLNEE